MSRFLDQPAYLSRTRASLRACTLLVCLAGLAAPVAAQPQDAPPTMLRLAPGQGETVARGTVTGYQTLTYAFDAAPGQEATVRLEHAGQAALYHNLIAPSGKTVFNGSMEGERFQGQLRERGRYQVRVYLMRNDARRGKRIAFTVRLRQSLAQTQPPRPPQEASGASFDCRRARGPVETAVCRSPVLSELDRRLDFVYRDALAAAPSWRAEEIRRDQRRWVAERDACSRQRDIERCLTRQYQQRVGQLEPKR